MYEEMLRKIGGVMAEDTYSCFMAAFKRKIDDKVLQQNELAQKTGVTYQHLNAIYKERIGKNKKPIRAGYELQQKIAEAFGYQIIDFLKFGEKIGKNTQVEDERRNAPHPPPVPGVQTGHINPTDVITAVVSLVDQYQKLDSRMHFWREIFDSLPVPTLIIKDGLVCYQNAKSRVWGNISGTAICDNCVALDCSDKAECPIHIAIETITATEGFQTIGGERYKVDVMPLRIADHEYFIVTVTLSSQDYYTSDRRSGEDRREE